MAPYAASYPAQTSEGDVGPVVVTMGLGQGQDFEEHMMAIDSFEEEVVKEIIALREDEVELPTAMDGLAWEYHDLNQSPANLTLVLDTNVLISHLSLLKATIATLAKHHATTGTTPAITFIIPSIAILELDGLKNSRRPNPHGPSVAELARAATHWLLSAIPSPVRRDHAPCFIRGQQKRETLIPGGEEGRRREKREGGAGGNDSLVLDAVAYFRGAAARAVLLTDDKNLRLRASVEAIDTMGVNTDWGAADFLVELDPGWRSRSMGRSAAGPVDLIPFDSPPRPALHGLRTTSPVFQRMKPPTTPTDHLPPLTCPSPCRSLRPFVVQPMEVDVEAGQPSTAPTSPADVLRQTSADFARFVASPLWKHITGHSLAIPGTLLPPDVALWRDRVGDPHSWDGHACARAVRTEWNDGRLEELCRRGIEFLPSEALSPSAAAAVGSSRSLRAPKRVGDVRNASLNLEQAWAAASIEGSALWSGGRWSVFLEQVSMVMLVVLAGFHRQSDLASYVENLIERRKVELRGLGLTID